MRDFGVFQWTGIKRQRTAKHLASKSAFLFVRKGLEGFEQLGRSVAHTSSVPLYDGRCQHTALEGLAETVHLSGGPSGKNARSELW